MDGEGYSKMMIEKITEEDIPWIHNLQPDGWLDIVPHFRFYLKNSEWCNPVKVKVDNRLVGIGCGLSFQQTGWLGHIIVAPDYRKQGIGSFIVNSLCNLLENKGIQTISLVATEFGYPVYRKAGFVEETEYLFFEREKVLAPCSSPHIVHFSHQNREEMISLDKMVSGEARENLLKQYLQNSYLYIRNHQVSGFYIPDLGEGLIIADTSEAGIELMKLRYSNVNKGAVPINNSAAIQFLKDNGFKESRRMKRMILGNTLQWKPKNLFNRIAGNLG
ncbi:MAG TPA: hypothetical protein DDW50_22675 [Firmicutes bacterium]|jgi:GNAT superfamily N-acetyltransferase|nr:hypothetical protein [Bacillota bacterium]